MASRLQSLTNDPGMSNRLAHDVAPPAATSAPLAPGTDIASRVAGAARGASVAAKVGGAVASAMTWNNAGLALRYGGGLALRGLALPLTAAAAGGWAAYKGYEAYKQGASIQGAATAAGWAAADSITMGIASMAYEQGEQAYASWAGPKQSEAGSPAAGRGEKAFAEANAKFERTRDAQPKEQVKSERKRGWGPEARIAAAKARGFNLPYNGDPSQAPDYQPTKKEMTS